MKCHHGFKKEPYVGTNIPFLVAFFHPTVPSNIFTLTHCIRNVSLKDPLLNSKLFEEKVFPIILLEEIPTCVNQNFEPWIELTYH